ncbi:MAG: ABC transporter permease [Lachnospiraceae bacterium]|jgi:peptide/nickel transport system permease protein|nr:ABC transporter permease [Lachnospiraceae bacterium]
METHQLSLNDDRRVKSLSPGALVVKRFFRNRLAVIGLVLLLSMFIFSFLGGLLTPYGEDEQFYTYTQMNKEYVGVVRNDDFRYLAAENQEFGSILQAQFLLAISKKADSFTYKDISYQITAEGPDLYTILLDDSPLAIAFKDIVNSETQDLSFSAKRAALIAYANGQSRFTADGKEYGLDDAGNILDGSAVIGYISRFVVQAQENGVNITRDFKESLEQAIDAEDSEFAYTDENGKQSDYLITYKADTNSWSVSQSTETYVYDGYSTPSKAHPLGTDRNGMDMLTRLMYGGRVSLMIGFIVVLIAAFLGVLLGGIAGYFGRWVDNLIMRIVDVFYCIPSTPLLIIIGAAMDNMQVDPKLRMLFLMLILGFLSWPSIARLVRGQILSLREQEFMTAAEACGIRVSRRIFRHLIPNVIPQLIVTCTMSLGSTILTEATLSFLGLGVKFPFASWGNIITDVNNAFVMTNYWFIWIPAGICLLITVLGFNFVGDGLRDAFDPRMKR